MFLQSIEKEVAVDLISLQTVLTSYNHYLQKLFLTLDSTKFILKPLDALQLADDFNKIHKYKGRLEIRHVRYLDDKQTEFYIGICNDIISNYDEVLELETNNGGNLAIATEIVENDIKQVDLSIFNYEGHLLEYELLKDIKGV